MNVQVRLSEQFSGFAAVEVPHAKASAALAQSLQRFGEVGETSLHGLTDVVRHLSPVKSFTTAYAVLGVGTWSIILTDMKGANCSVESLAISRVTGCSAIAVTALDQRRELHVYEGGQQLRSILSLDDDGSWYYSEDGTPCGFELEADRTLRPMSRRLAVARVREYFQAYTGMKFPAWRTLGTVDAKGLTRSIKDVRVGIVHYDTINDLLNPTP